LKRIETWQTELTKREKFSNVSKENKQRPKTSRTSSNNLAIDSNANPQDQKIIRDLQQLISKQEQLLRGIK
jgi:hypothetical protein